MIRRDTRHRGQQTSSKWRSALHEGHAARVREAALLPEAGAVLADPLIPRNVNYVFGMDDAKPQELLPAPAYLIAWISTLIGIVFVPTHLLLKKCCPSAPDQP